VTTDADTERSDTGTEDAPEGVDVRQLHRELVELHGPVERPDSERDGLRSLVTTILSQNVADENTARAADALFSTYPDYRAIEEAPTEELAETVRVAGLPETKAERIQRALERTREETGGEYTLAFLADMDTEAATEWLTAIKGIGPKTASVVLNFEFRKPTMAVDTHVERVAKRFGLVPETASNARAHDVLNDLVPDDLKYELHVLLIGHGREYCAARNGDCANPVCERYCDCEYCP
jgi:endonuclease-3